MERKKKLVPDGLVCVLSLSMLTSQLFLQSCMLGSALSNIPFKGTTALMVPLQLRIHFLQTATVIVAATATVMLTVTVTVTVVDVSDS